MYMDFVHTDTLQMESNVEQQTAQHADEQEALSQTSDGCTIGVPTVNTLLTLTLPIWDACRGKFPLAEIVGIQVGNKLRNMKCFR